MVIEDYKKINWLDFKKDFTVIKVFSDEECDKIIDSIDKNVDKFFYIVVV